MKRRTRGDVIAEFQDLRGCPKEEKGVKLFSKAPEDRTRSNRWKLSKKRSNQELRRSFLAGRTTNSVKKERERKKKKKRERGMEQGRKEGSLILKMKEGRKEG
ncbi:pxr-1, partial [Ophiophagus hannah]